MFEIMQIWLCVVDWMNHHRILGAFYSCWCLASMMLVKEVPLCLTCTWILDDSLTISTFGTLVVTVEVNLVWSSIDAQCCWRVRSIRVVLWPSMIGLSLYIPTASCKYYHKQQHTLHQSMRVVSRLVAQSLSLLRPQEERLMPETWLNLMSVVSITAVTLL